MKRSVAICYVRKSLVRPGAIDPISPEYQQKRLAEWCRAGAPKDGKNLADF